MSKRHFLWLGLVLAILPAAWTALTLCILSAEENNGELHNAAGRLDWGYIGTIVTIDFVLPWGVLMGVAALLVLAARRRKGEQE